ncbi:hypothetical protein GCM10011584_29240 [Nocardioides phosphati]|uniref:Uncharacterized protein n=1 Tax=Nocardioides phosphati TaxID=1867775 RepID=A0ABQ2NFA6_9ACTN|nr:hypothetical protein GCM10011584_29240 [Nocardioides phosphati]
MRRHRVTIASWSALAVVSGVLVAYAVNADGYPVHKAELNDGGVWVTNQAMGAVGRQNVPVAQIDGRVFDGAAFSANPNLDVLQDGSAVVSVNRASNSLLPIDAAMSAGLPEQAVTAAGSATLFGGGSLGALDPSTGKVWATTVDPDSGTTTLTGVTKDAKPLATVGGGAVGAAGVDGTLYAASGDEGKVVTLRRAAETFEKPETDDLSPDREGDLAAMTVVGATPVVRDDKGNVLTPSEALGNFGAGSVLQQSGPASDDVLVATPDALIAVAVDGGGKREVAKVGAQSSIAAPVEMANGCAFAAWGSGDKGTLVTACGDDKAAVNTFDIKDGAQLVCPPSSRSWRRAGSPSTAPPMTRASRSWSSPRRTPSSRPAPTACPRRSSTAS